MRIPLAFAALTLATLGAGAQTPAEAPPPTGENGRFQMTPAPNGFLRLDTRTGAVSVCTISGNGAECRAAADDRAALVGEVERLAKRNAELEAGATQRPSRPLAGLPSREDFGKAMDFAEEFVRRMSRVMRDENKDRM